jgi:hypothetical protein
MKSYLVYQEALNQPYLVYLEFKVGNIHSTKDTYHHRCEAWRQPCNMAEKMHSPERQWERGSTVDCTEQPHRSKQQCLWLHGVA